jgi:2-methylisocitrate lyase-like PEP mutase family enzyme
MTKTQQKGLAQKFRELHSGPRALVLCNAWDAASARVVEAAGFPAVATTSAGIANALGYPDGQKLPLGDLLWIVERITKIVRVPVSTDFEAGYASRPAQVAENCRRLLDTGAVGINLEDGSDRPEHPLTETSRHVDKIRAIREMSVGAGVPLVINARTDVYLRAVGAPESRFENTVTRLNAYRQAGADSLFAPGVMDLETIARLVKAVTGPLNILAVTGSPSIGELERVGVARVSLGSGPMRATVGLLQQMLGELKDKGTYAAMSEFARPYDETNRLFERK